MAQLQHHTHQMEKEIEIELDDLKMSTASESDSAAKTAENPPQVEQAEPSATGRPDMSAFASQVPMHESMVFKLGKGNLERIQKRYFVLYPGVILYYHHRTSYARDKKNGLKKGKFIRLDGVHLSKPESAPPRMKYSVVLHTPHEANKHSELLLAFHHKKDKNMWVELLQTQNLQLRPSLSEEQGSSKKKLPLYIHKMRQIEYLNPKSRYHMSRFHSMPNAHQTVSQKELESLRSMYNSFSSLPGHSSYTSPFYHEHNHLMVSLTDSSSFGETISEVEETESVAEIEEERGGLEFEVISERNNESDSETENSLNSEDKIREIHI